MINSIIKYMLKNDIIFNMFNKDIIVNFNFNLILLASLIEKCQ